MIRDDFHDRLDDLLSRWHHWADKYKAVKSYGATPACREYRSPPGYQSADDVTDEANEKHTMKTINFHVEEMQDPHRSAIYIHARNCYTGRAVWLSPRLPKDPMERAQILGDAKAMLIGKLLSAGIM